MRYEGKIGKGFYRWNNGILTPSQSAVIRDYENSHILLSGSYRSGKSEIGARLALRHAMAYEGAKVGIFRRHLKSIKRSTLLTVLELCHPNWVKSWSNTELVLELITGSTISFVGADDPDRIGSVELTYAFLDESHELSEETQTMIGGRLSGQLKVAKQQISKTFAEYAEECRDIRQIIQACNPKSKAHYLYQTFFEKAKPGYRVYTSNSIQNPNLPETYVKNMIRQYLKYGESPDEITKLVYNSSNLTSLIPQIQDKFIGLGKRNLLGLWGSSDLQIFEISDFNYVDKVDLEDFEYFVGAVDWGYRNPRILVCGVLDGTYTAVYYWAKQNVEPSEHIDKCLEVESQFNLEAWYLPPDQPGLIKTLKRQSNTRVKRAKNSVLAGIGLLQTYISQGKLRFHKQENNPYFDIFINEMNGYEWKTRDGVAIDEPVKEADHFPDCAKYLLFTDTKGVYESTDADEETESLLRWEA